jgi:hypothetical protein
VTVYSRQYLITRQVMIGFRIKLRFLTSFFHFVFSAVPYGAEDLYKDYTCVSWNGKSADSAGEVIDDEKLRVGYMNRAWPRLEILASMNLQRTKLRDSTVFTKHILKKALRSFRRPHFVYGLRESYANISPTLIQASPRFIDDFNPLNGFVSSQSDKNIISLVLHKLVTLKFDVLHEK